MSQETEPQTQTPLRVEALREAAGIISGDRNKQYGNYKSNFNSRR